jgi:hypothetical protein
MSTDKAKPLEFIQNAISRMAALAVLLALVAVSTGAQDKLGAAPPPPHVGVMTFHGMAGIVASVSSSEMQLRVPEHVTFTVHIGQSTRVTEHGRPTNLSSIHSGSGVVIRGEFNMRTRTVDAAMVAIMPLMGLHMLQVRAANFGKTWTAGIVTTVQSGSIALQLMDGARQTVQLDANTAYVFHNRSVSPASLRDGERVDVELQPGQPSVASRVLIQGMLSD